MLDVPDAIAEELLAHAIQAVPREACGVLVGTKDVVVRRIPMSNTAKDEISFVLDQREQLSVWRELEESGEDLVGIYHSHPTTAAVPTHTDELGARRYWTVHHVLISVPDMDVRSYRAHRGELVEETIRFITPKCS